MIITDIENIENEYALEMTKSIKKSTRQVLPWAVIIKPKCEHSDIIGQSPIEWVKYHVCIKCGHTTLKVHQIHPGSG